MSSPATGSIPLPRLAVPQLGASGMPVDPTVATPVTRPLKTRFPKRLLPNTGSTATAAITRPLILPWLQTNRRTITLLMSGFLVFSTLGGSIIRNALGWWGWGAWIALTVLAAVVWFVESIRTNVQLNVRDVARNLPLPLALFLGVAALSIAWSHYPLESAAGYAMLLLTVFVGFAIASLLSWREITLVLDYVTRIILAGSLLFEALAALIWQHPVAPAWASNTVLDTLQPQNWWTEANLFEGGRIHGLVGNAADLSLIAGISLIVLSVRITDHKVRYLVGLPWMALAAGTLMLARSTTIILALTVAAAVAAAVFIRRWLLDRDEVRLFWLGLTAIISTAFGALLVVGVHILGMFGKNPDLTGRVDLWQSVLGLIRQDPLIGHGWVGYWAPWIEDFAALTADWPMQQVHAHNAWLDVWLQVGLIGLLIFAALWFTSLRHSWLRATDVPAQSAFNGSHPRSNSLSLLPLLLLTLLLVQSLAESMILIEGTLVLFVVLVVKTHQLGQGRRLLSGSPKPQHH